MPDESTEEPSGHRRVTLSRLALASVAASGAALIGLILCHGSAALRYSVDIPLADDWSLVADGFTPALSARWLAQPHNEHVMVPTRLLVWLMYSLDGWNLRTSHLLNLLLYLVVVALVTHLVKKVTHGRPPWLPWVAGCFLLQAPIATNVLWGIQSSFHFAALFTVLSALLLFTDGASIARLTVGSGASLLAALSFGTGLAASLALLLTFWIRAATGYRVYRDRLPAGHVGLVTGIHLAGLSAYAWLAPSNHALGSGTWPSTELFWLYTFELLSSGFGRATVNFDWMLVAAALVILPMVVWVVLLQTRPTAEQWAFLAFWFASASGLAAVAYGRSRFGVLEFAKSARYAELGMLTVPLTLTSWSLALQNVPRSVQHAGMAILVGFLSLAGAGRNWSIAPTYRVIGQHLAAGADCAAARLRTEAHERACPELYPGGVPDEYFRLARRLRLSFTRSAED